MRARDVIRLCAIRNAESKAVMVDQVISKRVEKGRLESRREDVLQIFAVVCGLEEYQVACLVLSNRSTATVLLNNWRAQSLAFSIELVSPNAAHGRGDDRCLFKTRARSCYKLASLPMVTVN
jgi:hypothetical protein